MSCDCWCIPTPDSILEDDEIDVFEQIIPNTEPLYQILRQILWDAYGSRGIGNCDVTYWIKQMQRRYGQIRYTYAMKFKVFDEWMTEILGTDPVDLSDGSTTYTTVSETEDTPDNPQGSTKYLSDRNTVTYNGKTFSGLSSETVSRFMDYVPDLCRQFADEFRLQFSWSV